LYSEKPPSTYRVLNGCSASRTRPPPLVRVGPRKRIASE